ncbi:MAG: hypothetical protein NC201_01640 [Prevotella sp.]|nr:hypothetical protein [Bacteroides sp.]MCM1365931.1 hypothetical protein [Prevotella sp.]MCM1436648.1 hypothetical protein [Prevotella sp.]
MKKIIFLSGITCILAAALSSCSSDDPKFQTTVGYNVLNLVVPIDNSVKPYCQKGVFTLVTESYAGTVDVSCDGITLSGKTYKFNTGTIQMQGGGYTIGFQAPYIYSPYGYKIQSLKGTISTLINGPQTFPFSLPAIPNIYGLSDFGVACLISYEIPEVAIVKTFQRESYYKGTNSTQSLAGSFSAPQMVCRTVLDIDKNKGTVVVYYAQFNNDMEAQTLIIKDLDILFTKDGFKLTGENITPINPASQQLENLKIDNITFTANGENITNGSLEMKVANKYTTTFTGSLLYEENNKN